MLTRKFEVCCPPQSFKNSKEVNACKKLFFYLFLQIPEKVSIRSTWQIFCRKSFTNTSITSRDLFLDNLILTMTFMKLLNYSTHFKSHRKFRLPFLIVRRKVAQEETYLMFIMCLSLFQASTKEGYLLKQAWSFQRWRRRYFRIKGHKLFYAKSPEVSFSLISSRILYASLLRVSR